MSTLGNRARSKRLDRRIDARSIILDRQGHRPVDTLHTDSTGRGIGVLANITQAFLNDLNQLSRETIFDNDLIFAYNLDFQIVIIGKLARKTSYSRQETLAQITLFQTLRKTTQIVHLI